MSIRYKFNIDTKLYHFYIKVDNTLKQELIGIINNLYSHALKFHIVGYGKTTWLHIITRLNTNYYHITYASLKANRKHIISAYNMNLLFEKPLNRSGQLPTLLTPVISPTRPIK